MSLYCDDYFNRKRYRTTEVPVGDVLMGGDNPIRVQSMTTVDTMNTEGSIDESIRMIEAGCEIVRLTAPSKKEAENLALIKEGLLQKGYSTPLVADIHFTPNAAEIAANIVEKVRVNPGNYADKKKFEDLEYTDSTYKSELIRIEEKFTPLVVLCKKNDIAMRIGTNHGSLSDRILSRYGDTPRGMVESAMEFLRICAKLDYHNVVLSMKASNTLVMVQAYRLLVATMNENQMNYPLHLGVTEAGDGEDGRIKSAVGIGALLEDGIGDTVRVSLTEDPEFEIPVANKLLAKYDDKNRSDCAIRMDSQIIPYDPYNYSKRLTTEIGNIGGKNVPVVIADISDVDQIKPSHFYGFGYTYSVPLDKWNISDAAADYVYIGSSDIDFELPGTIQVLCDYSSWKQRHSEKTGYYPLVNRNEASELSPDVQCFIVQAVEDNDVEFIEQFPNSIILLRSEHTNSTQLYRGFYVALSKFNINNPVILTSFPKTNDPEQYQLWAAADLGSVFIDGFGDGIWLEGAQSLQLKNSTSFGILQATRTRISKTEYISCPSCGRTLFDLQETTSRIREKTSHLKGLKIGIMGCIVNGPGEMADADYGYVGTGPGKIHLYKEKIVVQKNVPEEEAVDALIDLIRENGDWVEPSK
jgi:(E)-4-hydroxy-3-methylbut-2-enyl-diphosphate synthase